MLTGLAEVDNVPLLLEMNTLVSVNTEPGLPP